LSAYSTGLIANGASANSLSTGLQGAISSIQDINQKALQMKLQNLNNAQSIDYYLISQMNNEAAAMLSIFR
jgi:hypothetical protein